MSFKRSWLMAFFGILIFAFSSNARDHQGDREEDHRQHHGEHHEGPDGPPPFEALDADGDGIIQKAEAREFFMHEEGEEFDEEEFNENYERIASKDGKRGVSFREHMMEVKRQEAEYGDHGDRDDYDRPPRRDRGGDRDDYDRPPRRDRDEDGDDYGRRPPRRDRDEDGDDYDRPPRRDRDEGGDDYGRRPPRRDRDGDRDDYDRPPRRDRDEDHERPDFEEIDADGSGNIPFREAMEYFEEEQGEDFDKEEFIKGFQERDANGDGLVDEWEFENHEAHDDHGEHPPRGEWDDHGDHKPHHPPEGEWDDHNDHGQHDDHMPPAGNMGDGYVDPASHGGQHDDHMPPAGTDEP